MVTREEVDRQIDRLSELPVLPQILIKLNAVAEDDHASADDLGQIILKDQALTMRVLKVVNSAYYRTSRHEVVTTISKAVIILGFNGIRRLCLGLSVHDMLRTADALPAVQDLWSHALATAINARLLAVRTGYSPGEEAFVAGLVHDIGRIVLVRCDPGLYGHILAAARSSHDLRDRERALFGMSHALAGRKLARRWNLPAALEEPIGEHHAHEGNALASTSPLLRLVIGANHFSRVMMGRPDRQSLFVAQSELAMSLGLNLVQVQTLHQEALAEYDELAQAFDVPVMEGAPHQPPGPDSAVIPGQDVGALAGSATALAPAPEHDGRSDGVPAPHVDRDELLTRLQAIGAALVMHDPNGQLTGMILDALVATTGAERVFLLGLAEDRRSLVCLDRRGVATPAQAAALAATPTPDSAMVARAVLGADEVAVIPLVCLGETLGSLWLDYPLCRRPISPEILTVATTLAHSLALALSRVRRAPVEYPAAVTTSTTC